MLIYYVYAYIRKARIGKKWYTNPEKTKSICCYPEQQPFGWTNGLLKNKC